MTARMSRDERVALLTAQRLAQAIEQVVNETPTGAPAGAMFAAVCAFVSLDDFRQLLRLLVEAGRVRKGRGEIYFPVQPQQAQQPAPGLNRGPQRKQR
jgi:hypothetical protein